MTNTNNGMTYKNVDLTLDSLGWITTSTFVIDTWTSGTRVLKM